MADNKDTATRAIRLDDISVLNCDGCTEPLSDQLSTCECGHTQYCKNCFVSICPLCKKAMALRNLTVEDLLGSIHSSCKNKARGCTVVSSYLSCITHEKECEYGIKICPMVMGCNYTGTEADLGDHVIFYHIIAYGKPADDKIDPPSLNVTTRNNLRVWTTEVEVDTPDACFPLFNPDSRDLLFLVLGQDRAWVCAPRSMPLSFGYTLRCGAERFRGRGIHYTPMNVPGEVFNLPPGSKNVTVKIKWTV